MSNQLIETLRNAVSWAGLPLKKGVAQAVVVVSGDGEAQSGTDGAVHSYPVARILSAQTLSVSGASVQSSVLPGKTVRLCANVDVHIAIGASPTATSSSTLLPAGVVEHFQIEPGWKVAALAVGGSGALSISVVRI